MLRARTLLTVLGLRPSATTLANLSMCSVDALLWKKVAELVQGFAEMAIVVGVKCRNAGHIGAQRIDATDLLQLVPLPATNPSG
jgi:hypothetical protein